MKTKVLYILLALVFVLSMALGGTNTAQVSNLSQRIDNLSKTKYGAAGDNVYQDSTFATNGIPYTTNGAQGLIGTDSDLTFTGGNTLNATNGTFGTATATTLNAPTGRGATYVIAASNATATEKAQADYVCTGVSTLSASVANGTGSVTVPGAWTSGSTKTVNGNGDLIVTLQAGQTATIWSGGSVVTNSPKKLIAGANTVTVTGAGTINIAGMMDDSVIQSVIDIMGSVGTIKLTSGTFHFSVGIRIIDKTCWLSGSGETTTSLSQDNDLTNMVEYSNPSGNLIGSMITDMSIWGNNSVTTAGNGLKLTGTGVYDFILRDVFIFHMAGGGIIDETGWGGVYDNAMVEFCKGVQFNGIGNEKILNSKFSGNSSASDTPWMIVGSATNVTGCQFFAWNSTASGTYGLYLTASYNVIENNNFFTTNSNRPLVGLPGSGNIILGNSFSNCIAGSGIKELPGASGNIISYNSQTTCTFSPFIILSVQQSISNTIINNNTGYIMPGEIRTISGTLAGAGATTMILALDNPFGQQVSIVSIDLITTTASAASGTLDAGTYTGNTGDTFTAKLFTALATDATASATAPAYARSTVSTASQTQTIPVVWDTGANNRYLNFYSLAATTSWVSKYVVTVMGN
jgi:hypothetical protein